MWYLNSIETVFEWLLYHFMVSLALKVPLVWPRIYRRLGLAQSLIYCWVGFYRLLPILYIFGINRDLLFFSGDRTVNNIILFWFWLAPREPSWQESESKQNPVLFILLSPKKQKFAIKTNHLKLVSQKMLVLWNLLHKNTNQKLRLRHVTSHNRAGGT